MKGCDSASKLYVITALQSSSRQSASSFQLVNKHLSSIVENQITQDNWEGDVSDKNRIGFLEDPESHSAVCLPRCFVLLFVWNLNPPPQSQLRGSPAPFKTLSLLNRSKQQIVVFLLVPSFQPTPTQRRGSCCSRLCLASTSDCNCRWFHVPEWVEGGGSGCWAPESLLKGSDQ